MRNIRNYGNGYTDRIFVCHLSEQTDWLQEATNKQTDNNSRSSASPSLTLYVFTLSPPSLSERGDPQQSLLTSAQKEFVLLHLQDNTFQLIIQCRFCFALLLYPRVYLSPSDKEVGRIKDPSQQRMVYLLRISSKSRRRSKQHIIRCSIGHYSRFLPYHLPLGMEILNR